MHNKITQCLIYLRRPLNSSGITQHALLFINMLPRPTAFPCTQNVNA